MNRETAIELSNSSAWGEFKKELQKMVNGDIDRLVTLTDTEQVLRTQEKIKAFKLIISLPEVIAEREE